MALEQFKTQVLLLHSEQSTLDALSAGFNDRYELHCATSGSEALNTLGVTPVDIIVSAHKLPGMSGLDALREAKKRSPKTLTILLAGNDGGDGLEALVSDKEVFQVVRGDMTPEKLLAIVENATKTARLMALSESANDTSADVDEPGDTANDNDDDGETGEHIVMETGENGSFIISDGTGQVPILKPEKISPTPASGSQKVDLLVLSQDEEFLATIRESSGTAHKVHHAVKPGQAEDFVRNFPIGVIVTDAGLAGASVEAMIARMRTHRERLVAIVAGRRDDGEMLMDLINRGHVYRFLLKPVSPGRARLAIEASVKYHLEAPEHAFAGRPGAKKPTTPPPPRPPSAKPAQSVRPVLKPVDDKPAPGSPATKKPSAAKPAPAKPASARPVPTPAAKPTAARENPSTTVSDGLEDAFDDATSFTETVTGIAASVGRSISNAAGGRKKVEAEKAPPATVTAGDPMASRPGLADDMDSDGSGLNVKLVGVAAAALIAIGVAFLFIPGGDDEVQAPDPVSSSPAAAETGREASPPPAPADETPQNTVATDAPSAQPESEADPVSNPPAPESRLAGSSDAELLLERARAAMESGDIFSPAGQNAVEFYLAASEAAPDDPTVRAELNAVIDDVFGRAEAALLEGRTTEASRALRVIELAAPQNPRLNFLNNQLAQQQLRASLDEARIAIRESRFEDAGSLLERAATYAAGNTAELDALSEELAAARNTEQLDEVLSVAGERLSDNRLVAPPNDNARYYFELARTIDPDSGAASQGLLAVASKLVLRARTAIDNGDLDAAEAILADARALDPNSAELAAADTALATARTPKPAAAPDPEPVPAAADTGSAAPSGPAADEPPATARQMAASETPAAPSDSPDSAAGPDSAEAASGESNADTIVSISALKRTKYVPPSYPRGAQRRNLSGYVDVAFTVTTAGEVADIEVRESDPSDVFDDAAVTAIGQWEFEPAMENGVPVSKRVAVRMSFNLQ